METDSSDSKSNPDSSDKDKDKTKEKTQKQKSKQIKKGNKFDYKWIVTIFITSFVITFVLSLLSDNLMSSVHLILAFLILLFFILLGVLFDIIGLSIATADEKQFHSMASRRILSAKYAIKLIRNAEKVSSFCNDVIGDIAGIVSGATGAAISVKLFTDSRYGFVESLILTSLIAAVTVGSKAAGKTLAINYGNNIVNAVSKIIYFFANIIADIKEKKKNKDTNSNNKDKNNSLTKKDKR